MQVNKPFFQEFILIVQQLWPGIMKTEDQSDRNVSQIMELSELSLFQEDPFSQEISILDQRSSNYSEKMHLLDGEVLFHEKPYFVGMEGDSKLMEGDYEALVSNYRALFFAVNKQSVRHSIITNHSDVPISLPFAMMGEIDIIKSQVMLKLKTGISLRIKSSISEGQQLYRHFLKAYMAIPFFPKSLFPQEQCITYDCLVEIQRQRMNWETLIMVKNTNGQLCSTYPKYFVVPKKIESNLLEECLKIRNFNRIPVATYYWNQCRTSLWRAARLCQQSNKFDQAYMKQISRQPFVINIREQQTTTRQNSLMASSTMGMKFLPLSIVDNLFKRLCISYAKDDKTIFKVIEPWYDDINRLIKCAYLAVNMMKTGKQVVIVQNLGFDRACQISALAQLLIDPFYRTINGFSVLVQKQFMGFGHPFYLRLGYQTDKLSQQSPIFIQFLESVYHLITSHPRCFEFSGAYLARLAYEVFAGKYNNFFFNDEGQKKKYELYLRTPNIWKHLPMRKTYYNYQWSQSMAEKLLIVLRVPPSVKEYIAWHEFYQLMSDLRGQFPDQMNAKKRRSSIYKRMNSPSPLKGE